MITSTEVFKKICVPSGLTYYIGKTTVNSCVLSNKDIEVVK